MSRGANNRRAAALRSEAELTWLKKVSDNALDLHAQYVAEGGYTDRHAVEMHATAPAMGRPHDRDQGRERQEGGVTTRKEPSCEVISLADERAMRESAKRVEASAAQIEPIVRAYQKASEMVTAAKRSAKLTLEETELRASDDLIVIARASGITPTQARDLLVRLVELDDVARGRVMSAIEARVERLKGGR